MKFKPEDFVGFPFVPPGLIDKKQISGLQNMAAMLANAKLEQWLEDAPDVIGWKSVINGWDFQQLRWLGDKERCTHKAKLVCIEEIK